MALKKINVPSPTKTIQCSGSSYEIGLAHGHGAAPEVRANIELYTTYFEERGVSWPEAQKTATESYVPNLRKLYPEILEEMKGIADGVGDGVSVEDILALNLRSEIILTTYTDGCTCLGQKTNNGKMFLTQNWDWIEDLRNSIVFLRILPAGSDITMHFMTEAGIVGKIGMNSAGVGICMNAIKSATKDITKLPVHIMMRRVLQFAHNFDEAVEILSQPGVSSAVNFMIADKSGNFADIECTPLGNVLIPPSKLKQDTFVAHTNHLYSSIKDKVKDTPAEHSFTRQQRMVELTQADGDKGVEASFETIRRRFSDKQGWPNSICRGIPEGDSRMEAHPTVCCCLMDLSSGKARFLIGDPSEDVPIVEFKL